jgi:hypothetical protein
MKKLVLALAVTSLAATACNQETILQTINAKAEKGLTPTERKMLVQDASRMAQYQLSGVQSGSYFDKIFGGTDHESVLRYLGERVHYLLSRKTNLDSRVAPLAGAVNPAPMAAKDKVYTIALNIGTALWLGSEGSPQPLGFNFDGQQIPLDHSRVGIIQLGNGYSLTKGLLRKPWLPTIDRVSTIVHEARHSDCTGGISKADVANLSQGTLPEDHSCGHMHVVCPAGHPLAGYMACDGQAWGAYAVQGVYEVILSQDCTTCTEAEKQAALAGASDALSRVLVLDDMVNGKLGDPDMSSSGVRE